MIKTRQELIDAAERFRGDAELSHNNAIPVSVLSCMTVVGVLEWAAGIGSPAAHHFEQAIGESERQARLRDAGHAVDPANGMPLYNWPIDREGEL